MHTYNPSSQKTGAGGWRLWGQSLLHNEIPSETKKQNPMKTLATNMTKGTLALLAKDYFNPSYDCD